ncbi:Nitrate reductase [Ophiocordyceps sinensis CO18]|uniref:Nitrate reductase n=1 Tax=Ophiocordyceps sinensis (strain Co18 / CGMCC 3.14243) TaxID=911162 RepID=T5A9T5_OPHSC|nr:Nitrate reductase [Ophiocordyceps sinensis CO18]
MELTLDRRKTWREDRYRVAPETKTLCGGKLDTWWRDTSFFCWCFWELAITLA